MTSSTRTDSRVNLPIPWSAARRRTGTVLIALSGTILVASAFTKFLGVDSGRAGVADGLGDVRRLGDGWKWRGYIFGPFGPDCDLRRYGLAIAGRGGMNAKKRAVIAVARKLAVLLHQLWISGATYDADYQHKRRAA